MRFYLENSLPLTIVEEIGELIQVIIWQKLIHIY